MRLYSDAHGSAQRVVGDDKTYVLFRVADLESLMRMHEIPLEAQPEMLKKVLLLQDIANRIRPMHPRRNTHQNRRLGRG